MRLQQHSEQEQSLRTIEQSQIIPPELALPVETYRNYHCNICEILAEEPVVSECGHLFCWSCIYNHNSCPTCKRHFKMNQFVPIYTSHQQPLQKNRGNSVPPKPRAKHREKIKNFSLGGNNTVPLYINYRPNVEKGITIAGSGFFPSTIVNALGFQSQDVQRQQNHEQENIKTSFGWLTLVFLAIVCFLIVLS